MQGRWHGDQGVFGMPVGVVLELRFIRIVFGMVLEATGAGLTLIRIAVPITGRVAGGPGRCGHRRLGALRIHLRLGHRLRGEDRGLHHSDAEAEGVPPEFAGAVEAAASTAGPFIPPVMGAVTFMLAQLTGTPHLWVCAAAVASALAYLAALFVAVYLEARRDRDHGSCRHAQAHPA